MVMLLPNGLGGYVVRQSDISAWMRCNLQARYNKIAAADPDAPQPSVLSATEFGTVVHYCLLAMQRAILEGDEDPLGKAIVTFEYYWNPAHIEECPAGAKQIDTWIARQTYGGLRDRGRMILQEQYEKIMRQEFTLLALEYQFAVPFPASGRLHTLSGQIDRLGLRKHERKPYLSIEDFKTGRQPRSLRWNIQGTMYAFATWTAEFWYGWPHAPEHLRDLPTFDEADVERLEQAFGSRDQALHDAQEQAFVSSGMSCTMAPRRFRWLNLAENTDGDGGWRSPRDFTRAQMAVDAYVRAVENEIYMPNMTGEVCEWCPHQFHCAGTGIATMEEGSA